MSSPGLEQPRPRITEITRRDLAELLATTWSGRLGDRAFLARLYDLASMPSHDPRYKTMAEDIEQHRVAHEDWEPDWVFNDPRLGLTDDDRLLRFVAETVHPAVVASDVDVEDRVRTINELLWPDGFELAVSGELSGRPTFKARAVPPRRSPVGPLGASLVSGLAKVFADGFSHTDIDSLFEDQDFPRPDKFGSNKVEKVKAWLRTADKDRTFDHWRSLGRLLSSIVTQGAPPNSAMAAVHDGIRATLNRANMVLLPDGALATRSAASGPSGDGSVSVPVPPPTLDWKVLGQGGFGTVYAYEDKRLGVDFAIKVFDPSPFNQRPEAHRRFEREAGILFRLRHENIIRVYDAGTLSDGRPYIKMERFNGISLQQFMDQQVLGLEDGVVIIGKLASALDHAHGLGIFHRDLKPSNVLVGTPPAEVRLIDFGLGIVVEEAIARSRLTTSDHHFGGA